MERTLRETFNSHSLSASSPCSTTFALLPTESGTEARLALTAVLFLQPLRLFPDACAELDDIFEKVLGLRGVVRVHDPCVLKDWTVNKFGDGVVERSQQSLHVLLTLLFLLLRLLLIIRAEQVCLETRGPLLYLRGCVGDARVVKGRA